MIPDYVVPKALRKNSKKAKYVVLSNEYLTMTYFETIEESLVFLIQNGGDIVVKGSNKCLAFRYGNTTRFGFGADSLTRRALRQIWWANWNEEPICHH